MTPRRRVAGRYPNRLITPQVEKALPAMLAQSAGGQIRTGQDALSYVRNQAMRGQWATPLPRDEYPYEFGPNVPLNPAPLDPPGRTGRAEPRLYEYPVSWNLPGQDLRLVPWRTLREAGNHPLIRAAITVRKQEVAGLEWDWTISKRAVDEALREDPTASRLDIEAKMRERLRPDIQRARDAWKVPDKGNGLTFAEWTSQFLEEHLVLDALPIYPRLTLGGEWYSFEVVDGATIKPLLDHRGGRPLPPQPAYQQIIHGFPRGEFTADTSDVDGRPMIADAYRSDQMIYIRREQRVASPYGLSPVERCLVDLDLWMKRQSWLRDEYDEGTMPAGWFLNKQAEVLPGSEIWSPSQMAEFETAFNDTHAGQTAMRFRYRMLPPGIEPADADGNDLAEKFKPEFDLHLMKLVLMHFDVTTHEMGFPEQFGLGGAGHAEGQDRLNNRRGRMPTLRWLAGVFTDISRAHLGTPAELEFTWVDLENEGADTDDNQPTDLDQLAAGVMTVNEVRDGRGQPRFSFAEADKPFIATATGGLTFIEGAEKRQEEEKQQAAEQAQAQLDAVAERGAAAAKPADKAEPAKKAEAKAYRAWARKPSLRPFVLKSIGADDLDTYGIDATRVTFGGDGLGKASWPSWAWTRDEQVAAYWTPRIVKAVCDVVDPDEVAAAWLELETTKALGERFRRAAQWLAGRFNLTRPLTEVIEGVHADGYTVGDEAAAQVLGETPTGTDWDSWTPGHPRAAAQVVGPSGFGDELRALLADTGITINSVAQGRFDDMAKILADGIEAGDNARTIAKALKSTLHDPSWAEVIAVTETARAVSRAALERYSKAGIDSVIWQIAPDESVCARCEANAAQGPIPTGGRFASGDRHPPGHPRCRCALGAHLD